MYSVGGAEILSLVLLIWILVLTYFFWRERNFLRQLFPTSEGRDIRQKLKELLGVIEEYGKKEAILVKNLRGLNREGLGHVQKVAILRYNPYGDTGGDQSFSAAFLDGRLNGVVITSLHSRAGTRVYAKTISTGQSELGLSKEERQVLAKAIEGKDANI